MEKAAWALAAIASLLLLGCSAKPDSADGPAVKKSIYGICHDRDSTSYERTKLYKSFDSMEACVASGGRPSRATVGGFKRITRRAGDWIQEFLDSDLVWLWITLGVLTVGLLAFAISWWRRRRADEPDVPEPEPETWEYGNRQDRLERKRWEGHRLKPRKKD